ncbi:hypothetical protein BDN72DRAFT_959538 [Pluteus cervinus]|uniref:Uncharacterized protein n=1 Tax=Pluteus cervinus TaxID=181527 RepID=A0ACD3AVS6_9AGAR|nr:hypothetical protein BDN72DRAFT_959538 [Pluteus cervinus]
MSIEVVPYLPTELQDDICELAARESHRTAAILIQVSRSISHRVERILYEVVIFRNHPHFFYPPHIDKWSSDIISFFQRHGHHIRYLLLDPVHPEQNIVPCLRLCPSLKGFGSLHTQHTRDVITMTQEHLPYLERLSGKLETVFVSLDTFNSTYQQLTHLDLIGDYAWDSCSIFLLQLPSLTHLALNDTDMDSTLPSIKENEMVLGSLKSCRRLEALLLVSEPFRLVEVCKVKEYEGTDIRIVAVSIKAVDDWLNGVRGGLDMWSIGDGIIMERRRKQQENREANS